MGTIDGLLTNSNGVLDSIMPASRTWFLEGQARRSTMKFGPSYKGRYMLEPLPKIDPTDKVRADDTWRQSAGNQIAWMAGFFDGEGSMMLQRRTHNKGGLYCVPTVNFANTHKPSIERISSTLSLLGIGHHVQMRPSKKGEKLQYMVITAGMKRVMKFISMVEEHLFTKKEQASTVKDFIALRLSKPTGEAYGSEEWVLYDHVRELNHLGSSETTRAPRDARMYPKHADDIVRLQ